jgi:hypothetical protein
MTKRRNFCARSGSSLSAAAKWRTRLICRASLARSRAGSHESLGRASQFNASQRVSTISSVVWKTQCESRLSLGCNHSCSSGLSLGELGGRKTRLRFSGTTRSPAVCQPALSISTRCAHRARRLVRVQQGTSSPRRYRAESSPRRRCVAYRADDPEDPFREPPFPVGG